MLMNYIALLPGKPTRMHFTDSYWVDREIADKETGKPKPVRTLVFWCDELEGEDVAKTFSVLSQKLYNHLEPFLKEKLFLNYDFIITKIGDGFMADFNVQPILRRD